MMSATVRHLHGSNIRRRLLVTALLLSGGAPFAGCFPYPSFNCGSSSCDPPVGFRDPLYHAGGTVSLRTPAAGDNGVTLFARTGALAAIDNPPAAVMAPIPGVTTGGTAGQRENITVPIYGGVTIPAKNVGLPIPNLSFEAFGGADLKHEKTSFYANEAFGGGVASASQTYWSASPAVGAGIQYHLGTFYGVPTSLGAAYIVDLPAHDHVMNVASQNIPGIVYTYNNPGHVTQTAAFTLNFDLPTK
jgi:hypothetical protein